MSKKTIFMDSESEDGYISYSDEDCCTRNNQEAEDYEISEEVTEKKINSTVIQPINQHVQKIKNKERSLSIDSESSDNSKKPNYKCGSCKKPFILEKNQNMIRCSHCGYRILYKLRTKNYISYKTE